MSLLEPTPSATEEPMPEPTPEPTPEPNAETEPHEHQIWFQQLGYVSPLDKFGVCEVCMWQKLQKLATCRDDRESIWVELAEERELEAILAQED